MAKFSPCLIGAAVLLCFVACSSHPAAPVPPTAHGANNPDPSIATADPSDGGLPAVPAASTQPRTSPTVQCGRTMCDRGCCRTQFPCAQHPEACGGDTNGWSGADECGPADERCGQMDGAYQHRSCDDPGDCGRGEVCCDIPSARDKYRFTKCVPANECTGTVATDKGQSARNVVCRQASDCPSSAKCNRSGDLSLCATPPPPKPGPRAARSAAECNKAPSERAVLGSDGSLTCQDFPMSSNEPPRGCLLCGKGAQCPHLNMCPYGDFCNSHKGEIPAGVARVAPGMGCCECDTRQGRE